MVGYAPVFDPRSNDVSIGGCGNANVVADFHDSTARVKIATAPARTSKSWSAAHELWADIYPDFVRLDDGRIFPSKPLHENDRLLWIVGPDYKTAKEWDYLWHLVLHRGRKAVPTFPYSILNKANSPQQGNLLLYLEWGKDIHGEPVRTKIIGKSATNPESLQGEQVDVAVLSEAAELPEAIWNRYLATRTGKAILPTTPKLSAQWILDMIRLGEQDTSLRVAHFHFDRFCNPKYDHELFEIERRKAASRTSSGRAEDDHFFAEQFLGEWTMAEERVLPFFEVPTRVHPGHVVHDLPAWFPYARKFISCDYGYDDAAVAVFFAVGPAGELLLFSEVYDRRMTAMDFVSSVRKRAVELHLEIDYLVGDPKKPEVAAHMRQLGLPVMERVDKKAMADRATGFLAVVDLLSLDPETGKPRLQILSDRMGEGYGCPKGIREWNRLRRKMDSSADQWSDTAWVGDDHFYDAVRYGVMTRPKPKEYRDADRRALERLYRPGPAIPMTAQAAKLARVLRSPLAVA